jgi:hypothetical protein
VEEFDGMLIHLKGYRDGAKDERVRLEKESILFCFGQD